MSCSPIHYSFWCDTLDHFSVFDGTDETKIYVIFHVQLNKCQLKWNNNHIPCFNQQEYLTDATQDVVCFHGKQDAHLQHAVLWMFSAVSQISSCIAAQEFSFLGAGIQIILIQFLLVQSCSLLKVSLNGAFSVQNICLSSQIVVILGKGNFNFIVYLVLQILNGIRCNINPIENLLLTDCQLDFESLTTNFRAWPLASFSSFWSSSQICI